MMSDAHVPGFWMNETSGVLRPVVEAYLNGAELSPHQVAIMRAYLRQWIAAFHETPDLFLLRRLIDGMTTHRDVERWMNIALNQGIDPL